MSKITKYIESYMLPGDSLEQRQLEWAVWYSGLPERIANYYDEFLNTFSPRGSSNVKFWGNQNSDVNNDFVHMPLAGDIASISANLLFSEPPEVFLEDESENEERFRETLEYNKFGQRIVHAAEVASAIGGVYLKVDTSANEDYPIMTVRYPDCAIPYFKPNGDLDKIKFHRLIKDGKDMYRLYEKRYIDDGLRVEFELIKLKDMKDSKMVPLTSTDETKDLSNAYFPSYDKLGVVYIPNMLPNRQFPRSHQGISDYAGCISLLDSLDEAWTSWVNDVTLGQGRVFVDQNLLDMEGDKFRFDPYKRAIMKVDMASANMGEGHKPIESIQFDIRADEHLKTCMSLTQQIISMSGYSPQSFGLEIDGRAESGTALRIRERKSMLTKQKKARYWMNGLQDFLTQMQEMDNLAQITPNQYEAETPSVSLADSIVRDPKEVSETVRNLYMAKAISTYQSVKMNNEDWSEEQIKEEVDRINAEFGVQPEPSIGG